MRKTFISRLALRSITGHKLRSVLTIAGIAIGVGFIIFLISLGYGLQRISTQEVANLEALQIIEVSPGKSKIIKIDDDTIEKFMSLSDVEAAEPQLSLVGTFSVDTGSIEGVVYGKDTDYLELEETDIEAGRLYSSDLAQEVVINKAIATQFGFTDTNNILGETVTISTNIGSEYLNDKEDPLKKEDDFKIVGVLSNSDSPYAYVPLEVYTDYGVVNYSSAKVKVGSKEATDTAKQQIENLGYKTTTLKDTVDQINQFFGIFQLILLSFGAIAVLIAALGMFNTLTISLLEKTREISFMKVLGTNGKDIWRMFIAEALLIGFIGSMVGILAGLLVGGFLNDFLATLAERTGNKPVEIFYAPFIFTFATFAIAMIISFLTGIYPSYRASKIDPLEALRYE
ncbi:MAG: ABC transporter permease [Patescibacteria group bacterium]|nr:ABC transporter permease [Patescibacteria group bacterium]